MATTTKLDHATSVSVLGHPVDKHIPRAVQTLSLNEKTHGTCQHLDLPPVKAYSSVPFTSPYITVKI